MLGLACVCIFLCFYGLDIPVGFSPLLYLGRISYGLYVFHGPCQAFVKWLEGKCGHPLSLAPFLLFSLALTIISAMLSHRYIEQPFLRLKDRYAVVKTREV